MKKKFAKPNIKKNNKTTNINSLSRKFIICKYLVLRIWETPAFLIRLSSAFTLLRRSTHSIHH